MKLALEIDQDLTDKIFKAELEDLINMVQNSIEELYSRKTLHAYQVEDLTNDKEILEALIKVYKYTNIDGDKFED